MVLDFKLFGFWFGYVLFVILIGYALYFDIDLFPLHYYIWFDSQVLWLFDVAKGGEKWGLEKLRNQVIKVRNQVIINSKT